ncbi:MAG: hypothetical protein ACN4GM_10680 [Gammaproteobacteria bacterium]
MPKTIQITVTEASQEILSDALKLYAELAFPVSGSECNLVARDALTTTANEYERQHSEYGYINLSSRIKPLLKAAITSYYKLKAEQSGVSHSNECELLLSICEGRSVSDQQLEKAKIKDLAR